MAQSATIWLYKCLVFKYTSAAMVFMGASKHGFSSKFYMASRYLDCPNIKIIIIIIIINNNKPEGL